MAAPRQGPNLPGGSSGRGSGKGPTGDLDVEIVIEAKTAAAVANLEKLAQQTKKTEAEAAKLAAQTKKLSAEAAKLSTETAKLDPRVADLDRVFGKAGTQFDKSTKSLDKFSKSAHHGKGTTQALGSAIHNVSAGQATLSQATNMVLSSFGPWGMVIGAAAAALGHFVIEQMNAGAAAEKTAKEIRAEIAALRDLSKHEQLGKLVEADRAGRETNMFGAATDEAKIAQQKAEAIRRELKDIARDDAVRKSGEKELARDQSIEYARQLKLDAEAKEIEEDIFEIEKQKVLAKKASVDTTALETQQLRQQAAIAKLRGDTDAETQLLRQVELRELAGINTHEKTRVAHKKKQLDLQDEAIKKSHRENELARLQKERERVKREREEPFTALDKEFDDSVSAFEDLKAKAVEDAKDQREAVEKQREEAEKKRHKEELARLEQKKKAHEALGSTIGGALGDIAAISIQAGLAGERGFKKMLGAWGKAESIKMAAIALSEGVQAVVSAATWNIPQAIQHGEAAAQAAATAVVIAGMTGAVGGFGSIKAGKAKGAFGGSDFGGGSGSSSTGSDPPQTSNSQKDQMPTASNVQYAQAGGASRNGGGTNIVVHAQVLGAIDDQTGLKLAQGIKRAQRKLGATGS